jgi:hypothetical protein
MPSLGTFQDSNEDDLDFRSAGGDMIKDVLAMTGAIDSDEIAGLEAEYSLLEPKQSNGSSRTVGGNLGNSSESGRGAANLWGSSNGVNNNDGNHGLPSPIGTVNGHSRRLFDNGIDNYDSNGMLSSSFIMIFF